jgi:cell wall assembly regulator SMI1
MAAETNVITTTEMAKVRELDYAQLFTENIQGLIKMLGITRKIPVVAGTALKKLTVTGTLHDGEVDEGDIIPLSKYETTWTTVAEASLLKWRKATTAEAILKGGFDQAVNDTDKKMILDIQKGIRSAFITDLASGTGSATGVGLQAALANAWGQLQTVFEDDDISPVYFVNPQDIADYLGKAQITTQTSFGFTYIENFLGLGTVITSSLITKGTFYATAAQNLVVYYVDVNGANGIGDAFDFTTDSETGLVGIHEESNYTRLQSETVAIAGVTIFAEIDAGVIKGTITAASNEGGEG